MSEERIRQLEREKGFWKRLALVALIVLALVLLGSASLSGTLYYSLREERARWGRLEQQQIETEQRARREAERVLREAGREQRDAERAFREAVEGLKLPDQGADKKKRD
jgi:hypothetical protein